MLGWTWYGTGRTTVRKPNIRRVVVSEETLQKLLRSAESVFRAILLVAYDHGPRKGKILQLRWEYCAPYPSAASRLSDKAACRSPQTLMLFLARARARARVIRTHR